MCTINSNFVELMAMGIMIISALKIVLSTPNAVSQWVLFHVWNINATKYTVKLYRVQRHLNTIKVHSAYNTRNNKWNKSAKKIVCVEVNQKQKSNERPTDRPTREYEKKTSKRKLRGESNMKQCNGFFLSDNSSTDMILVWMYYYVMLLPQCVIACYGLWRAINSSIMNSEAMTLSPVIHISIWHQMLFHISCQRFWLVLVVSSDRNGYEN